MDPDEQAKRATLEFDEFVSALPATLAIGGVLVYGVLIVAYVRFFGRTRPELKRLRLWLLGLNVVFVSASRSGCSASRSRPSEPTSHTLSWRTRRPQRRRV